MVLVVLLFSNLPRPHVKTGRDQHPPPLGWYPGGGADWHDISLKKIRMSEETAKLSGPDLTQGWNSRQSLTGPCYSVMCAVKRCCLFGAALSCSQSAPTARIMALPLPRRPPRGRHDSLSVAPCLLQSP